MKPSSRFTSLRAIYVYLTYKLRLTRDKEDMLTTIDAVRSGATMTGANLWVLVTAIFTAALGLNVNSTAVIIGAMLISPLMGPIMAMGMGLAIQDFPLVYRALKNFGLAVLLSLFTSSIYFWISPLKIPGSELLARTTPTIYDVFIAIFGGVAGIIAGSSKLRQSNVIPGVAIATALMPPLCTVGFGIANLNATYIVGAFYLFFINTVFISLATYAVVKLLRYPQVAILHSKKAVTLKRTIFIVSMLALIPSVFLTFQIVRRYVLEEKVKQFIANELSDNRRLILKTESRIENAKPYVDITVLGPDIDSVEYEGLKNRMQVYGLSNAVLHIQQGYSGMSGKGSFIGNINNTIEYNSEAIGRILQEMQEMKTQMGAAKHPQDSLQTELARTVKAWMPNLTALRLEKGTYYNAVKDSTLACWIIHVSFSQKPKSKDLENLPERLKEKLSGDTVLVKW